MATKQRMIAAALKAIEQPLSSDKKLNSVLMMIIMFINCSQKAHNCLTLHIKRFKIK
jgi:hypothetical protein